MHRPLDAMRQQRGGGQLARCDASEDALQAVAGLLEVVGVELLHVVEARRRLGRVGSPRQRSAGGGPSRGGEGTPAREGAGV